MSLLIFFRQNLTLHTSSYPRVLTISLAATFSVGYLLLWLQVVTCVLHSLVSGLLPCKTSIFGVFSFSTLQRLMLRSAYSMMDSVCVDVDTLWPVMLSAACSSSPALCKTSR